MGVGVKTAHVPPIQAALKTIRPLPHEPLVGAPQNKEPLTLIWQQSPLPGVTVGVRVTVGVGVIVGVRVPVGSLVLVRVWVMVDVGVEERVDVTVGVEVGVQVLDGVRVAVGVRVNVRVALDVGVTPRADASHDKAAIERATRPSRQIELTITVILPSTRTSDEKNGRASED